MISLQPVSQEEPSHPNQGDAERLAITLFQQIHKYFRLKGLKQNGSDQGAGWAFGGTRERLVAG